VPASASATFSPASFRVIAPSRRATAKDVVRLVRMSTPAAAETAPYAFQPSGPASTPPMIARKVNAARAEKTENCAIPKVVPALCSSPRLAAATTAPMRNPVMIAEGGEKKRPSTSGAADMPTDGVLRRTATATGQRSAMKKSTARPHTGRAYPFDTAGRGKSSLIHRATAGTMSTIEKSRRRTLGPTHRPSGSSAEAVAG